MHTYCRSRSRSDAMDARPSTIRTDAPDDRVEGRRVKVGGIVQGVGFRPWVHRLAARERITGRVWNDSTGATIEAFGDPGALERFVKLLLTSAPPAARIDNFACEPIAREHLDRFEIAPSRPGANRRPAIPADLATCPECLAEIFDPADRRYRYAFTNCTNCGPRFTIARDIPYDRPATTMARFPMCPECRREYQTPADRRFHAQPNACPICGPRLRLIDSADRSVRDDDDPIRAAAAGDYRMAKSSRSRESADFTSRAMRPIHAAVRRLRERKHRDEKPFAVMVRDTAEAERLAHSPRRTRRACCATERPIVIVRRRRRRGACARNRAGQSRRRRDAAVHSAASSAAARKSAVRS